MLVTGRYPDTYAGLGRSLSAYGTARMLHFSSADDDGGGDDKRGDDEKGDPEGRAVMARVMAVRNGTY